MSSAASVQIGQRPSLERAQGWARSAVAGDKEAFSHLFEAYHEPLVHWLMRETRGDRHLCDDVAQSAWVAAMSSITTFDPDRSAFWVWLKTVARNKLQDHYRRTLTRRRSELGSNLIVHERREGVAPSAEDVVEASTGQKELVDVLRRLSPRQAAMVALVEFDGLSVAEAALELGMKRNTAKLTHWRALVALSADKTLRSHRDTRDVPRVVVHTVNVRGTRSSAPAVRG